jgi:hypothetical protein
MYGGRSLLLLVGQRKSNSVTVKTLIRVPNSELFLCNFGVTVNMKGMFFIPCSSTNF